MDDLGYRGPAACAAAGITYRQLDYWARTALVEPSLRGASGSGSQRLYTFRDILMLRVVKRLLDVGVSLQNVRLSITALRGAVVEDFTALTLLSDGQSVYLLVTSDEVLELLQGATAVYGIGLRRVVEETTARLAGLPGERSTGCEPEPPSLQVVR